MPIAYPYKLSHWYGYDKDCSTLTSFYVTTSSSKFSADVCDVVTTVNLWHNGSNALPIQGDTIYQNSAGTLTANWAGYKGFSTSYNGTSFNAGIVNLSGVVQTMALCIF
tara:strand:+ start:678 stop:1004 length:327 start_codon:yes stop_codon:yes gene_type:complete